MFYTFQRGVFNCITFLKLVCGNCIGFSGGYGIMKNTGEVAVAGCFNSSKGHSDEHEDGYSEKNRQRTCNVVITGTAGRLRTASGAFGIQVWPAGMQDVCNLPPDNSGILRYSTTPCRSRCRYRQAKAAPRKYQSIRKTPHTA